MRNEKCKVKNFIVVLCGPTGSGKTKLSIELAPLINAEIISADSRQIYKHLDIGTGKLSPWKRKIPHHLLDAIRPNQAFNAHSYQRLAYKKIKEIFRRGKNVLIVGGTGLYIKSVTEGLNLSRVGADEAYRGKLQQYAKTHGKVALHEKLKKIDPVYAKKIHPNDITRVIRAMEVYKRSGMPFSNLPQKVKKIKCPIFKFALKIPRDELYERINARVDEMLKTGLLEEVNYLIKKGYKENLIKKGIIGYREIIQCLNGKCGLKEAVELLKKNTRNYAKRQMTWFNKDKSITWIDINDFKSFKEIAGEIKNRITDAK